MKKQSWKVSEIAGSAVYEASGEKLGILADVLPTGVNDVWVIIDSAGTGKELLIPALKTVVLEVDVENRKIVVKLPPGLREIYETSPEPAKIEKKEVFED